MKKLLPAIAVLSFLAAAPAAAQSPANVVAAVDAAAPAAPPPAAGTPDATASGTAPAGTGPVVPPPESTIEKNLPFTRSLFFTPQDLIEIDKALRGIKVTSGDGNLVDGKLIPQVRRIKLTGMSYVSQNNWIIWLNGQKVTPFLQPKELKDIRVEPGVVHLWWFDIGANKVLFLSLRPHEIYDIVTGVTLPDPYEVKK